jgi:H/ACA ribonucleoprotein complex subunit 4
MRGRQMQKMLIKSKRPINSVLGRKPEERSVDDLLKDGVVVMDKPSGPTSHQVTSWVQNIVGASKAAHGGTLDPRATGILPVGLGNAVRAMDALHVGTKAYVGVMRMHGKIDLKRLDEVSKEFVNEIFQTPPMKSAVKREMRTRRIHRLEILEVSERDVLFRVDCDAGTYIRSLAVDIGDAMAIGAHLQDLRRTRGGILTEDYAVTLHDLKDGMEEHRAGNSIPLRKMLHPKEILLAHIPKVQIKDSTVDAICHGADLAMPGIIALDERLKKGDIVAVMTLAGEGVGLGRMLMDSGEVMKRSEGIAIDVYRGLMAPGTYPRSWSSSKDAPQQK